MGFLTIINYIAMGIGYFVSILALIFFLWLLGNAIKDKQQRKKWESERADKEKVEKILTKEDVQPQGSAASPAASIPATNKPVEQTTEQTTQQNTAQATTQTTATSLDDKKEASKSDDNANKNNERLIDESGKLKMTN